MEQRPRNRRPAAPRISVIIATRDRCAELDRTLSGLADCGMDRREYEVIVVDNASRDRTASVAAGRADRLIRLRRNLGSCAKDVGVDAASGRYVLFLDDDSSPRPGSMERMIQHFRRRPRLGAAGFEVHLSAGGRECAALPDVFLGCGVGFRTEALRACGGLDRSLFMQAEEYDLCFRLVGCGWAVRLFGDLHVDHRKTPSARRAERTTFYDIRNNLRVAARHLPIAHREAYRRDMIERYGWLAQGDGNGRSFARGARSGRILGAWDRWTRRCRPLSPAAFEHFYRWRFIQRRMAELALAGVRRIVLADLGKNIYAFHRAAEPVGLSIAAIGDDRFAARDRTYRGVPVLPLADALTLDADAVIVSNCAGVFAAETEARIAKLTRRPVHAWFSRPPLVGAARDARIGAVGRTSPARTASPECDPRSAMVAGA